MRNMKKSVMNKYAGKVGQVEGERKLIYTNLYLIRVAWVGECEAASADCRFLARLVTR